MLGVVLDQLARNRRYYEEDEMEEEGELDDLLTYEAESGLHGWYAGY